MSTLAERGTFELFPLKPFERKVGVPQLSKPSFRQVKFDGRLQLSFSAHVVKYLQSKEAMLCLVVSSLPHLLGVHIYLRRRYPWVGIVS